MIKNHIIKTFDTVDISGKSAWTPDVKPHSDDGESDSIRYAVWGNP